MGSLVTLNLLFNAKRIAILGAGPSGLATAKCLLAEQAFDVIDIYEQQAEVGGVWNYTPSIAESVPIPQTTPHVPLDKPTWPNGSLAPIFSNPMYDRLNTNIPKGLMCYSDLEFPLSSLLFPTRQDVQEYLIQYSEDLRHLIRFSTQVEEVNLSQVEGRDVWSLSFKSTTSDEKSQKQYDAVVIANGHYSAPFIPSVPGIVEFSSKYTGVVSHSKIYRSPDSFTGKKVIVVGNAASGLDIGTQISTVCQPPLLNSVRTPLSTKLGQENKEEVPPIAEYIVGERAVKFEDGRIEKDIDAIVYCTGYLYSYPFLKSLDPPVITTGRRVHGIYRQIFNTSHPTLAFTALPQKIIPFPLSEAQAAAIAKVWSNQIHLPNKEDMELAEKKEVHERGDATSFHVLGFPSDAEYINGLHDWVKTARRSCSKEPAFWGEEQLWVRSLYLELRKAFVDGGGRARSMEELGFKFGAHDS